MGDDPRINSNAVRAVVLSSRAGSEQSRCNDNGKNKGSDESEVEVAVEKKPHTYRRNAHCRKRNQQDDSG
jgi:hypothetical protein